MVNRDFINYRAVIILAGKRQVLLVKIIVAIFDFYIWTWIEMYRNNLYYLAFVGSSTPISQTNVFPVWFPTAISWNATEIVIKVMMWSILRSQLQLQSVLAAKSVILF